jgi:Tol biopolymer transport system component
LGQKAGQSQIWIQDELGAEEPRIFVESKSNLTDPVLSPDGRWMAYVSDESGVIEVYVQAFPGGEKHKVSTNGGVNPVWARNGRELFFLQETKPAEGIESQVAMMAVDFAPIGSYRASAPHNSLKGITRCRVHSEVTT